MRTVVAALGGIIMFFIGVFAISEQAQLVEPETSSAAANRSFNMSVGVFEGVTQAGGQGIVWFGVAAVVLVACGLLVAAARSGGR